MSILSPKYCICNSIPEHHPLIEIDVIYEYTNPNREFIIKISDILGCSFDPGVFKQHFTDCTKETTRDYKIELIVSQHI